MYTLINNRHRFGIDEFNKHVTLILIQIMSPFIPKYIIPEIATIVVPYFMDRRQVISYPGWIDLSSFDELEKYMYGGPTYKYFTDRDILAITMFNLVIPIPQTFENIKKKKRK